MNVISHNSLSAEHGNRCAWPFTANSRNEQNRPLKIDSVVLFVVCWSRCEVESINVIASFRTVKTNSASQRQSRQRIAQIRNWFDDYTHFKYSLSILALFCNFGHFRRSNFRSISSPAEFLNGLFRSSLGLGPFRSSIHFHIVLTLNWLFFFKFRYAFSVKESLRCFSGEIYTKRR